MHGDWDPSPFAPSTTAARPSLAPLILAPKFSSSPSFLPRSLLTLVHPLLKCKSPSRWHIKFLGEEDESQDNQQGWKQIHSFSESSIFTRYETCNSEHTWIRQDKDSSGLRGTSILTGAVGETDNSSQEMRKQKLSSLLGKKAMQ